MYQPHFSIIDIIVRKQKQLIMLLRWQRVSYSSDKTSRYHFLIEEYEVSHVLPELLSLEGGR